MKKLVLFYVEDDSFQVCSMTNQEIVSEIMATKPNGLGWSEWSACNFLDIKTKTLLENM